MIFTVQYIHLICCIKYDMQPYVNVIKIQHKYLKKEKIAKELLYIS